MWAEEGTKTQSPHYCEDAKKWAVWVNLVKKYPEDDDLRTAYALRVGLCEEVKASNIETDRAIALFERFLDALKFTATLQSQKEKRQRQKEDI